MTSKHRTIVFLVLVVMVAGLASAARRGRLVGRVVDPEGTPIEGVSVTATCPEVPEFNEFKVTDRKGVFKLDFEEVNVTYHYVFEKSGFQTLVVDQHWSLDGKKREDYTMVPGEAPTTGGDAPAASSSLPAVLAYNAGLEAYRSRDLAAAQTHFEESIEHDPDLRQAWGALSLVHVEQKHYQEAVDAAEKAMALGSMDEMVLRSRWEAYRNLGDEAKTAEAQKDMEQMGALVEEAKRIYNEGVALAKAGDHQGAYDQFKQAAEIDPTLQVAQLAYATEALRIEHSEEAVAAADEVLKDDPENARAIRIRYNAALQLGDEELIIDALVDLAKIEFELARDALFSLALAAYDANSMEQAKALFGRVLEVDPNNARSHYHLALIYVNESANQEAMAHLETFLQLAPDDPDAATAKDLLDFLKQS